MAQQYTLLGKEYCENEFAIFDYRDGKKWVPAAVLLQYVHYHGKTFTVCTVPQVALLGDGFDSTMIDELEDFAHLLAEPGSRIPKVLWNWPKTLDCMVEVADRSFYRAYIPRSFFEIFDIKKCDLIVWAFFFDKWNIMSYVVNVLSGDDIEMYTVRQAVEKMRAFGVETKMDAVEAESTLSMWHKFPGLCIFFKADRIYEYFLDACKYPEILLQEIGVYLMLFGKDLHKDVVTMVGSRLFEENLITSHLQPFFSPVSDYYCCNYKLKKYQVLLTLKKHLAPADLVDIITDYLPWFSSIALDDFQVIALKAEVENYYLRQENARLRSLVAAQYSIDQPAKD